MGIMRAISKCQDCYKGAENCLLTLRMKERCKGPYNSKQAQIAALRAALTTHRAMVKEAEQMEVSHG